MGGLILGTVTAALLMFVVLAYRRLPNGKPKIREDDPYLIKPLTAPEAYRFFDEQIQVQAVSLEEAVQLGLFDPAVWEKAGIGNVVLGDHPATGKRTLFEVGGKKRRRRSVRRAPCSRTAGLLRFLVTRRAFETVYEPQLADLYHEHAEALKAGKHGLARWIAVRGWFALLLASLAMVVHSTVGRAVRAVLRVG